LAREAVAGAEALAREAVAGAEALAREAVAGAEALAFEAVGCAEALAFEAVVGALAEDEGDLDGDPNPASESNGDVDPDPDPEPEPEPAPDPVPGASMVGRAGPEEGQRRVKEGACCVMGRPHSAVTSSPSSRVWASVRPFTVPPSTSQPMVATPKINPMPRMRVMGFMAKRSWGAGARCSGWFVSMEYAGDKA
jgi:hypothetical protein